MVITDQQLLALVNAFMLPFIRIGAFFMAAPFFGAGTVPVRVRILLAIAVTVVLQPAVKVSGNIDVFSAEGLMHVLQQILVGLALGAIFHFVMASITLAGHNVATTMGLGFASSADPHNGGESTTVGQFYTVIATLYFLGVDAHLRLLGILAVSFNGIPLQQLTLDAGFFRAIVAFSAQIFVFGTLLVLPVIVGLLLVNLAFAVMTRAAPQLNVFSLGLPLTILAGFVLMILSVPVLAPLFESFMDLTLGFMSQLGGA
ncbi:MAG TPA: flagellar biosynthetic protein FliR [Candidatus Acidoferrum sp.]|nr:flagellar biosynthetic protein FliR [Candidatus Acidoferrum sp.]